MTGSKADAERMKQQVQDYVATELKLNIAEEKSSIVHAQKGVDFLGYTLKIYTGRRIIKLKRGTRHTTMKSVTEQMQLHIPKGRLEKFCTEKGYGNYQKFKALHRPQQTNLSEVEIISIYNAELQGLANYYALAKDVKTRINKPYRLWQVSLFKTLAAKRKQTVNQIARSMRLRDGSHGVHYHVKGETRTRKLFRTKTWKMPRITEPILDLLPRVSFAMNTTELVRRLNSQQCEYCETMQGPFEIHHVRGLKSIQKGKEPWQQMMIARNRKTLVLCRRCHRLLTAGKLPAPEKLR